MLGLKGPCFAINTACSSALVGLDAAYQTMRLGKCKVGAVVGGVNLLLHPWVGSCALRALSADGQCKAFDVLADGYGRGDACGVVLVQAGAAGNRQESSLRMRMTTGVGGRCAGPG